MSAVEHPPPRCPWDDPRRKAIMAPDSDPSPMQKAVIEAVFDPGSFTGRGYDPDLGDGLDNYEPLERWQARAVEVAVEQHSKVS